MDSDVGAQFIAHLTKSLQTVIHSYMEFEANIELGGYIYLKVDNADRIDYVLSEKMLKSNLNSVTFRSNSFHALPQSDSEGSSKPSNSRDKTISTGSSDSAGRSAGSGHVHSRSSSESPVYSTTASASGKAPYQNIPLSGSQHSDTFTHPKGVGSNDFQISPGSMKIPSNLNKNSTSTTAGDSFRSNNRSLTDFQTAFRNPPASLGSQIPQSSPAHSWNPSHNGSNTARPSASHTSQQQQQQQSKSGILPDPSDMEVVHIKTEEEDDVFNIPLQCSQGGSESESKPDIFQSLASTQLPVSGSGMIPPAGLVQTTSTTAVFMSAESQLGWMDSHIPPISTQSGMDHMDTFHMQGMMQTNTSSSGFPAMPGHFAQPLTVPTMGLGVEALNSQSDTVLTCSVCNYVSNSRKSLARHMSLRHFRQGDFACGECGKVFQTKLYLNQHMKSHGERKYICEVCGQKFLYKHHLPRHQQAVHGAITCYNQPPLHIEDRDDLPVVFENPS